MAGIFPSPSRNCLVSSQNLSYIARQVCEPKWPSAECLRTHRCSAPGQAHGKFWSGCFHYKGEYFSVPTGFPHGHRDNSQGAFRPFLVLILLLKHPGLHLRRWYFVSCPYTRVSCHGSTEMPLALVISFLQALYRRWKVPVLQLLCNSWDPEHAQPRRAVAIRVLWMRLAHWREAEAARSAYN